ncbi:rhomboid family intramembrane serine protease GlpG [Vibrio aestuarianus]|uniref:Rhomboid protease n=1 Tax=Vibrio aestuarianus TaxID=28171 RepID=A0ABM9FTW8_9VIBR|nr:rhomboid family intramembrane serine protease GlpG [Vibrio aestuarianus]MDE1214026.1 rhomboid family intramembrane serine protease GlpG [Vibrio aestuarianus]MDE1218131.1 rhomboid family intramembrane serine protease GlpG [Vibrio aestuarianus]MDE1226661.1 rhomboid family intramembrane serine protease GlpG [Vibrio aestuarianus]MDE1257860.1 rhomboid family intramembrane serine protease GlpG [Vibrio aestuarianus]MDE1261781.1 rhomboid family intramembrane serine protease GlpG [Vibrio aestuarianu
MLRLITLNNPRMAQAFIDYMASRRIEIQMMPEGSGQFVLWLLDDQYQVETEAELTQFLQNPNNKKYQAASWDVAETRNNHFQYRSPSMLAMVKAKAGPLTLGVMSVCLVIFTLQQFGLANEVFSALHFPAVTGQQWQIWRWFSHALLHFSVLHIVFNLLWWWQLGGDIEKKLGSFKLGQLFLLSAALSGAAQYWVEGANFGGLSGVVYALVGYLWMLDWRAPNVGLQMPKPLIGFMLVWLVLGFVQPFMAIANSAHLAGLIAGVALGLNDASRYRAR